MMIRNLSLAVILGAWLATPASAASLEPIHSDGMPLPASKPDLALIYPSESVDIAVPAPRPDLQSILPRATRTVSEMFEQQTGVETGDSVVHLVAGRQHQHRRVVALRSEPTTHAQPVGVRHRHVEQKQVGGALGVELERASPIACGHDLVALEGEDPLERRADSTVVFGDQDPVHARTFPRLGEKSVRWVAMRTSWAIPSGWPSSGEHTVNECSFVPPRA